MASFLLFIMKVFLYVMKKHDLFPDTDGKIITVFLNEGLQFCDILTCQIIKYREVQTAIVGIMARAIKKRKIAVKNISVGPRPDME